MKKSNLNKESTYIKKNQQPWFTASATVHLSLYTWHSLRIYMVYGGLPLMGWVASHNKETNKHHTNK